jgi:spectrin beta
VSEKNGLNECMCLSREYLLLSLKVNSVQEESAELQGSYAGDKQDEIKETEREVVDAWNHLTGKVRHRTTLLGDSDEYYKFCIAVQDQLGWMNDMQRQILTYDKSRCVWCCDAWYVVVW